MDLPSDSQSAITALREHVYGPLPTFDAPAIRLVAQGTDADGVSVRDLELTAGDVTSLVQLALPNSINTPIAVFIGLNFAGNQNLQKAWPLKQITEAGFGIATACYQDWYTDNSEAVREGPRAISTWAAALTAIRRVISSQAEVDPNRIIAIGHSRLGKTALWAAANDPGFAACVSIQSGCGGAAPNHIQTGEEDAEQIANITSMFPHWFADAYAGWAGREAEMPFDQHWLLAAIAPHPVLLLNAEEDRWANPAGQDRMVKAARPAFPNPDLIQSHTRPGGHEVLPEDWRRATSFIEERWIGER